MNAGRPSDSTKMGMMLAPSLTSGIASLAAAVLWKLASLTRPGLGESGLRTWALDVLIDYVFQLNLREDYEKVRH